MEPQFSPALLVYTTYAPIRILILLSRELIFKSDILIMSNYLIFGEKIHITQNTEKRFHFVTHMYTHIHTYALCVSTYITLNPDKISYRRNYFSTVKFVGRNTPM